MDPSQGDGEDDSNLQHPVSRLSIPRDELLGSLPNPFVTSPLAQAAIARDLLEEFSSMDGTLEQPDDDSSDSAKSLSPTLRPVRTNSSSALNRMGRVGSLSGTGQSPHPSTLSTSYHRTNYTNAGPRATIWPGAASTGNEGFARPNKFERREGRREERSLLRDNNIIPPRHPRKSSASAGWTDDLRRRASVLGIGRPFMKTDEESDTAIADECQEESPSQRGPPNEQTALLGGSERLYGDESAAEAIEREWIEAVASGKIKTTWQRELKVLIRYSVPLVATCLLQYSLTVASIFTVGHIGTVELGAVSLASMTANITGYVVYAGLATSLDTLCAQAYGSGRKTLVGLQMLRMIYFLLVMTIPIAILWLSAEPILLKIMPEPAVAVLAGKYLKILIVGTPGYVCFEAGKRYTQAQGLFSASFYVLLICAPLNALMNYVFVWRFGWGFVGAPIAVAITDCLMPICLFAYVYFIDGRACWPGFTRRAFHNWGPMIRLAIPGLLMVVAECLAFEILTLAASYFGTEKLGAQSILATTSTTTFYIPFPISIATSTRIANLIGATLSDAAKVTAKVSLGLALCVGLVNVTLLSSLRNHIPLLFSSDPEVIYWAGQVMPIVAASQLCDSLAALSNGMLRGLGRQEIGGWVQLVAYYVVAMPVSMGTAFGLGWHLYGLWTGVAIALALVALTEGIFLMRIDWERSVEDARQRNENL